MAYTFRHGDRPLDDYTVQRAVGRGGFGEVYYAVSDGGREVALKYLRDNPHIELRGISHCMNLKSPHLVSIFDVKKNADGDYFVIMEYVSGPSLRDILIAEPNGIGPQKAAFFIREIAKGLAYLHDRGIVHRDLKPGNIFYDEGYVKIGDYGLSKFISVSRHSAQTASVGTVHYMAPEVGSGNYHRGIDIYALGVMLYEMLLGKVPFEGSSMGEVLMKHLTEQPEVDNLPAPFGPVIRKALAKDPAERYQDVYAMVEDLLAVDDVQSSLAGFNPMSLSQAPRRIADEPDSPMPSPNPPPRRPGGATPQRRNFDLDARQLPPAIARRVSVISDKVDKRVRTLEARLGRSPHRRADEQSPPAKPAEPRFARRHRSETIPRLLLALVMAVGLGVVLGLIVDARDEGMISAIMMCVGLPTGVALGCWGLSRISREHQHPPWIERLCLAVPTAPVLALGLIPIGDVHIGDRAIGVWAALMALVLFGDWRGRIENGERGELSLGKAFMFGLFALIATAIFTEGNDHAIALGTGVAAVGSLVIQAVAWLFPLGAWINGSPASVSTRPPLSRLHGMTPTPAPTNVEASVAVAAATHQPAPYPHVRPAPTQGPQPAFLTDGPPRRWMVTRVFALFLAIAAVVGAVGGIILLGEARTRSDDAVMCVALIAGSLGVLSLALGKLRSHPIGGFYRDTARPVLMAVVLPVVVATAMAVFTGVARGDDAAVGIVLMIMSAMVLFFLLVMRGRAYSLPTERHAMTPHPDPAPNAHQQTDQTTDTPAEAPAHATEARP